MTDVMRARDATGERPAARGILFGCDYNPEQWDRATWVEDVDLMQRAGISLVALNVFGWAELQDPDGGLHFDDLDEILDLLQSADIRVNLGTGTSSPPPWLTTRHPEMLPVMADGTTRYPGGRQAWCPSSPVFRRHALALVEALAERYGAHPAVELWHVSNELGGHNAHCYCDVSTAAFRGWLEARYRTIDHLNRAWGTAFWSQRYYHWDEIGAPRQTISTPNPAQVLDFRRFSSDELLDCYRAERDAIRSRSDRPVTTNLMVTAHIDALDYWTWARELDVIANDHYLDHRLDDPELELGFAADLTRGLAGGAPWLLMEQAAGAVNWQPVNQAKPPGRMLLDSLRHVARGADALCFFQWRASTRGAERFHSALVPHAGTDTATWRRVRELGDLLGRMGEVAGSRTEAGAALLFSWEAWWAASGEGRPSSAVRYLDEVHAAYGAVRAAGVPVDIVAPGADLSGYRMVVVPHLWSAPDAAAHVVEDAARNGASVLVTFGSGVVDTEDRVRLGGYPGAFRDLLGVRMEEFAPLAAGETVTLESGATARLWTERGTAPDAEVVDRHLDGPAAGSPAVTRREVGTGAAWYLATALEPADYHGLVARIAREAGLDTAPEGQAGFERIRRRSDEGSWLFLLNGAEHPVETAAAGVDLLTGESLRGTVTVPAGGCRVIREEAP